MINNLLCHNQISQAMSYNVLRQVVLFGLKLKRVILDLKT